MRLLLVAALFVGSITSAGMSDERASQDAGRRILRIAPIAQQTPVWCWAATGEMVFRHFGLPNLNPVGNYQCGIVAAYFGGPCMMNCGQCVSPIASMSELNRVIQQYGIVARQVNIPSPVLRTRLSFQPLSLSALVGEIDANRPVLAGITAGGFPFPNISQHVVVIVGYDVTSNVPAVFVNDPFPYNMIGGRQNPYFFAGGMEVAPGRYCISYQALVGFMAWANTISEIATRD